MRRIAGEAKELVQEYQIVYRYGDYQVTTTPWVEVQARKTIDGESLQEIVVQPLPEGADNATVRLRHTLKPRRHLEQAG